MQPAEKYSKFAQELWDGFETISKHTAKELEFCKDVLKFFKKRVEIETEYSKSLSKLAQKTPVSPTGTLKRALEDVGIQTQNIATSNQNVQNLIQEKVVDSLGVLIKDMEKWKEAISE